MIETRVVLFQGVRFRMFLEDRKEKHSQSGTWSAPSGPKQCRIASEAEVRAWVEVGGQPPRSNQAVTVQIGTDTGGW